MQPVAPKPKYDEAGNEIPVRKEDHIPYVFLKRSGTYRMAVESNSGITRRLNHVIDTLGNYLNNQKNYLEVLENEKTSLQQDLEKKEDSYALQIQVLMAELQQLDEELGVNAA